MFESLKRLPTRKPDFVELKFERSPKFSQFSLVLNKLPFGVDNVCIFENYLVIDTFAKGPVPATTLVYNFKPIQEILKSKSRFEREKHQLPVLKFVCETKLKAKDLIKFKTTLCLGSQSKKLLGAHEVFFFYNSN